jgi:GTP cyclohydrolase I
MKALYNLESVKNCIDSEHTKKSPDRVASAIMQMFEGCWQDPKEVLSTVFTNPGYDEILYCNAISFVSTCAHHNLSFFGKAYFGYLPDKNIVGLSKIPRLVEVFSHRPQIQEKLTIDIIDTFNDIIKPKGCGLVMEGIHLCMAIRGVKNESAYSKTAALRGCFREGSTKAEFLSGIQKTSGQIWP